MAIFSGDVSCRSPAVAFPSSGSEVGSTTDGPVPMMAHKLERERGEASRWAKCTRGTSRRKTERRGWRKSGPSSVKDDGYDDLNASSNQVGDLKFTNREIGCVNP